MTPVDRQGPEMTLAEQILSANPVENPSVSRPPADRVGVTTEGTAIPEVSSSADGQPILTDEEQDALADAEYDDLLPGPTTEIINAYDEARAIALRSHRTRAKFLPSVAQAQALNVDRGIMYKIYRLLVSGTTPEAVAQYIQTSDSLTLDPDIIRTYLETIPPDQILPPTYLQEKYLGADITIDPIGHIFRIVYMMEERLGAALVVEAAVGIPSGDTTDLAESVFGMLESTTRLLQRIGELPDKTVRATPETPAGPSIPISALPLLKDVLGGSNNPPVPAVGQLKSANPNAP